MRLNHQYRTRTCANALGNNVAPELPTEVKDPSRNPGRRSRLEPKWLRSVVRVVCVVCVCVVCVVLWCVLWCVLCVLCCGVCCGVCCVVCCVVCVLWCVVVCCGVCGVCVCVCVCVVCVVQMTDDTACHSRRVRMMQLIRVAEHLEASSRRPRHPFPALMAGEPWPCTCVHGPKKSNQSMSANCGASTVYCTVSTITGTCRCVTTGSEQQCPA